MADGGEVIFKFLGDDKQLTKTLGKVGSVAKTVFKGLAVGAAAVGAGFAAIVKSSVEARAEMEQLVGGAKKIFDEIDYGQIEEDARNAYKTMNLSAAEYIDMMNHVGATFAATMGDQKGYETAKQGMQAIADFASGTGENLSNLNEKYKLITRSSQSYQSICDQFASLLPQTSKDFLAQAQAAGYLEKQYKSLKDVPLAEYQQAVTNMLQDGVEKMNLLGNTAKETETTLTGSIAAMKASWANFLSGEGDLGTVLDNASIALDNVLRIVDEAMPHITEQITANMPKILDLAGKILTTLADGIIQNLPIVLDVVIVIIDKVSEAMLQNGDKIGEISYKLMVIAAKGFLRAIPHVLLAISDIIGAALLALTKFNDKLWQKGFELLVSFVKGTLSVIGRVQNAIEQIKTAIRNKLSQLGSSAYNWGRDMIEGFKNGIMAALGSLREQVSNVANSIRSMLHFSKPDERTIKRLRKMDARHGKRNGRQLRQSSTNIIRKNSRLNKCYEHVTNIKRQCKFNRTSSKCSSKFKL